MKKSGLIVILAVLCLGLVFMVACGGKKNQKEEVSQSGKTVSGTSSEKEARVEEKPGAKIEGGEWKGVPVYPGAKLTDKMSVNLPITEEVEDIQYAFFETSDSIIKVASFYQTEMPKKGWSGAMTVSDEMAMGTYERDEENEMLVIMLGKQDNKTEITLASGRKK